MRKESEKAERERLCGMVLNSTRVGDTIKESIGRNEVEIKGPPAHSPEGFDSRL